ncbi:Uncharacterised protein [Serratia quinivorans]|nr:Uncharacterised protein [Serratia quinivorans]CAI2158197.1 Uncharacterised protein [Serratia quinivorans]
MDDLYLGIYVPILMLLFFILLMYFGFYGFIFETVGFIMVASKSLNACR